MAISISCNHIWHLYEIIMKFATQYSTEVRLHGKMNQLNAASTSDYQFHAGWSCKLSIMSQKSFSNFYFLVLFVFSKSFHSCSFLLFPDFVIVVSCVIHGCRVSQHVVETKQSSNGNVHWKAHGAQITSVEEVWIFNLYTKSKA